MATYKINEKLNGIEISFEAKPSEEVRSNLKAAGFRWSPKKSIWYTRQTDDAVAFAKVICESENSAVVVKKETAKQQKTMPEEKANKFGVKVGDLFVDCFGYDATIYNFYQVTAIKGNVTIEVREVGDNRKTTGFCSWDSKPIRNKFIGDPMIKRTKTMGNEVYAGDLWRKGDWDRWYQNDNYH